ncbi:YbjQ family protein [Salinibacter ruber]|uniref:YbjQ family protein n=1 Tax=Salinibacter ruber TaxID=146919 RepID=UPI0021685C3D|nr:YbjQ family protein [Salinibacter ruber]MCS3651876.1 uncharacterized protein YbjQ (UPF0145 family) [Salinibacter ruber]
MAYGSAQDIIASTTPRLEGQEVQEYLGPVSSHLVAGTNIFSDIAASFSDLFGGRSKSYRKQLEKINEEVIGQLKEKAANRRANALVGLQVDNDQISGQNKEMFMVTASATAVRAEPTESQVGSEDRREGGAPLPAREMEKEVRKEELLEEHQSGILNLDSDSWQFLIENGITDFAEVVRHTAREAREGPGLLNAEKKRLSRSRDYFLSVPMETAKEQLYPMASHDNQRVTDWAVGVLEDGNMLDLGRISSMLDGDFHKEQKPALEILSRVDKPYYEEADLQKLKKIRGQVESGFGKRGEMKKVEKSGMMSSGTEEVWQVEGGPENPMDREYCQETGLDIYGFEKGETRPDEVTEILDRKIRVLKRQFGG